ncbi:Riboflavin biosynthesis protein RibD [Halomicronema hongdechloris C2206]|uniref:Riboflavin biosynthesis protein RibD n=1 Tax=Halomicronema hongdechloris C2206 TaxID=1641165 RepID=A0A1Z3HHC7_9CYAN|nr:RibD family protein [Halomicronema hongdechloris]ASC69694.1 Riboflavin biosynthesis protein RibD [Halomicronema hongdechloris C2206]
MLGSSEQLLSPYTTVILAMSVDGKIADYRRSAARFSSAQDLAHLEAHIARMDGILFGAATLRAYGTTLTVRQPSLLQQRQQWGQLPQPVNIVCSRSGDLDPQCRFFRQLVPRWLLTTVMGARRWQQRSEFERILPLAPAAQDGNWRHIMAQLGSLGLRNIAVLGGGALVAALLAEDLVHEVVVTVCPLLLGGHTAPTLVDGSGFLVTAAPRLQLVSVRSVTDEVFLHYRLLPRSLQSPENSSRLEDN